MAAAAEPTDGPTLSVVSKWLHALRKKHNKIIQIEEPLADGRKLNKEQGEDLLALIYFGSLFDVKPQTEFVATMLVRAKRRHHPDVEDEEAQQDPPDGGVAHRREEAEQGAGRGALIQVVIVMLINELKRMCAPLATALAEELSSRPARSPSAVASSSSSSVDLSIEDLLALIYFGSLFDVKPQTEFVATMLCGTTPSVIRVCRVVIIAKHHDRHQSLDRGGHGGGHVHRYQYGRPRVTYVKHCTFPTMHGIFIWATSFTANISSCPSLVRNSMLRSLTFSFYISVLLFV
ncbi:hypothetical protein OsI_35559 [Oryza sativa Indica Group]|uniref:Uncharacterized protein n=1 Tax=Oryza sativa subsp. indica TaxID=39946 RepID=B8BJQ5_ORYSI|nr:hypothetical protein OsI_35559 [Oryza sativa Indica Group]